MKNNVLILSAGRRVELIKAFQRDLSTEIPGAKVFATDMYPVISPACQVADHYFSVPRVTDENYINIIREICIDNNVGLIVPTIDTELLLLSEHKEEFKAIGIQILVADMSFIQACRDKRKTADLFTKLKIDQPKILDKSALSYPCFCKPYDGSCSKGALVLNLEADLTPIIFNDPKNIFMELVPKTYSEYTIDGYYNNKGTLKCLVPRKRIEVRAGEVSKGVTRKHFVYDYLLERVSHIEGAIGCITYQLFVNEETKSIKGLEINPRFGGGYPLADSAGATFAKWAIQEFLCGQEILFFDDWEKDLLMLRYDAKVLVNDYT
jgi:carbamoyl-phosphate synthase large subunit